MPTHSDHSHSVTSGHSVDHGHAYSEQVGTATSMYSASDPSTIARAIFEDELTDVLTVLRNCGALLTSADRTWALGLLSRLFDDIEESEDLA